MNDKMVGALNATNNSRLRLLLVFVWATSLFYSPCTDKRDGDKTTAADCNLFLLLVEQSQRYCTSSIQNPATRIQHGAINVQLIATRINKRQEGLNKALVDRYANGIIKKTGIFRV